MSNELPTSEAVSINQEIRHFATELAHELREHPERWVNRHGEFLSAVNAKGKARDATDADACAWCIEGFMEKKFTKQSTTYVYKFREAAGIQSLCGWNDEPCRTVADIIDLCEKVANG